MGARERRGCLGRLLVLGVVALLVGFAAALWLVALPQELAGIAGAAAAGPARPARNLVRVLESSLERGHLLPLTEDEINGYLKRTLATRQGGVPADWVTLDEVLVRLDDGLAEVIMVRRVAGHPCTVSMFLGVEQTESPDGRIETHVNLHGGPFLGQLPWLTRGGRFGRLVVPQGFLVLVLGSFERLAAVYDRELTLAFEEMARVRIEKGRLVLDPRVPGSEGPVEF